MNGIKNGFMNRLADLTLLKELGGITRFVGLTLKTAWRTQGNWRPIVEQVTLVYTRSLTTVIFAGVFVGAILVVQFHLILAKYDAQSFLGGLNTSSVIREVGPLIISFLLAGKVGAYTAAELGTMRVTEQIEAIECLGTNPVQYLIVPRFLAITISSLLLLIVGLLISVAGSILVSTVAFNINPMQYLGSIPRFTSLWTLSCGMFRSLIYGIIVASVACYKGYTATGGARGVGRAVTQAAVYTNLYIVVANFVTGSVLDMVAELARGFLKIYG